MRHNLLFVGDIVLESQPRFSSELQALFEQSTICCGNVEAPLQGVGKAIDKTGPLLTQKSAVPAWLNDLGFNLFVMANNHIYDYGEEGMLHSMQAFAGKDVIGVGDEEQAYGLLVKTIDNIRYGFLAYGENGYGALNGERTLGHAWINHPRVNTDIMRYRQQVDVLIVQVHAGVEMVDVPIPEWRERYRELIDFGADVVIGHHPHVVQGMEKYKEKYICYSLGNFYFDGIANTATWNTGALLRLEVEDGHISNLHIDLVEKKGQTISLKQRKETEKVLDALNSKLSDETGYLAYIDAIAVAQWHKHHAHYYAKPFNGLSKYTLYSLAKHFKRIVFNRKTDYNLLWHNIAIESNFWIVKRAIQKLRGK